MALRARRLIIIAAMLLGACDELGNPIRRPAGGELSDAGWRTETTVESLAPESLPVRLRKIPATERVYVDPLVGAAPPLVLVEVRFELDDPRPQGAVHLVSEIDLRPRRRIERSWVVRGDRRVGWAVFALPDVPARIVTRVER